MEPKTQIIYLSPEQTDTLAKLTEKHNTTAHIYYQHRHGHIEVEFLFPDRYMVTKDGSLWECYDLQYNKYRQINTWHELETTSP